MARAGSVLAAATLLAGVTACSDDTPNEPQEQIGEGDLDQVELDQKEGELDEIEEDLRD